jgi:hypothetical protein
VAGEVQATVYAEVAALLRRCGARLTFVSSGSPTQAAEYLRRYEKVAPFPCPLLLDPERVSHRAFQLKYGVLRSLIPPMLMGLPRYGCENVLEGLHLARRNWSLVNNGGPSSWQQGGTFVLRKCALLEKRRRRRIAVTRAGGGGGVSPAATGQPPPQPGGGGGPPPLFEVVWGRTGEWLTSSAL